MLIVSIHGFRPKLTLWEHIPFFGQFFSPTPDIWRTAERFMARCKELAGDSPVRLIRIGYKDVVYKSYKRWFFRDRGREKTIALIKQSYIKLLTLDFKLKRNLVL